MLSNRNLLGRALICVLVAVAVAVALVQSAAAHAMLKSSDPAANAILDTAPAQIVMHFTEPLEPSESSAVLEDATGTAIAGAQSSVDPTDQFAMILSVPANLANGTYVVRWKDLSAADGHPMNGFFAFTIGGTTHQEPVVTPTGGSEGPPYWLITVVKWLTYVGLALVVAVWPLWLVVVGPAHATTLLENQFRRVPTAGLLMLAVGSLAALVLQGWLASPDQGWFSRTWDVLTDTRYGTIWAYRMAAILVFASISVLAIRRAGRLMRMLATAAALAIPLTFSLIAHAAAQTSGRSAAIAADWLHVSAAMIWSGGLIYLLVLVRSLPLEALPSRIPQFTAIALGAWLILALTGSYNAWLQVGSRSALTDTSYGKTLLIKLAVLLPILILATLHLLVFNPRISNTRISGLARIFQRTLLVEAVLMLAVLLAVGRLVGLQPAGEAKSGDQVSSITRTLDGSGHAFTLTITPGTAGPNSYRVTVPDAPNDPKVEVLLRLTPPGATAAQSEIPLTRQAEGDFTGRGLDFALTGDWTVSVIVRQIGAFQWEAATSVSIALASPPASYASPAWRFDGLGAAGMIGIAMAIAAAVAGALSAQARRAAWFGVLLLLMASIAALAIGKI